MPIEDPEKTPVGFAVDPAGFANAAIAYIEPTVVSSLTVAERIFEAGISETVPRTLVKAIVELELFEAGPVATIYNTSDPLAGAAKESVYAPALLVTTGPANGAPELAASKIATRAFLI